MPKKMNDSSEKTGIKTVDNEQKKRERKREK